MPQDYANFFYTQLQSVITEVRNQPLELGGVTGSGGGSSGRPQGYLGRLPQQKVTYDLTELATDTTSGDPSLVDNLNHIRYKILQYENNFPISGWFESNNDLLVFNSASGYWIPSKTITTEGITRNITEVTSGNYSVLSTDHIILAKPVANILVILPSGVEGKEYTVKRTGTGSSYDVTVSGTLQNIDDEVTQPLGIYTAMKIVSDSNNWWII